MSDIVKKEIEVYLQFPNVYALRKELSWTHYRSLIRVENPKVCELYTAIRINRK